MPTYIPGISSAGTLAPGLTAATVRAVLELLSVAEIAAAYATTEYVDDEVSANGVSLQAFASNASNLSSGTVSDARLSSNVPRLNAASNTFAGRIRSDAAIVNSNGTQGSNGPSIEMAFANYGIGANANGEPVSIINATVRNRLGVDIVVGSNGSFGIGNAAHAGTNSTVDTKITRYGPQTISIANASGTSGFVARADNGRILVGYDAGGDYLAAGNVLGTALPLYIGSGIHSMIRFVPNDITIPSGGQIRSLGSQSSRLYLTEGFGLGTGFSFAGYNSTAPAMTYYMEPSGAWTLRQKLGSIIAWTDNGSTAGSGSSITSTLSQASAGVLQVGTTSNNALGSLNLANLTASGVITTDFGSGVDVQTQAANYRIGHRVSGTFRTGFDLYHLNMPSSYLLRWSNSGSTITTLDTTISRASAGVIQVGSGSSANANGSLLLTDVTASGVAKFTGYPTGLLPAAASNAGSITYDTTLAKHVGCNGSSWNALW